MTEQEAIEILKKKPWIKITHSVYHDLVFSDFDQRSYLIKSEKPINYEGFEFPLDHIKKRNRARIFLKRIGKYKKELNPYDNRKLEIV